MRVVRAAVLLGSSLALAGPPVSLADLTVLAGQQEVSPAADTARTTTRIGT